MVGAAGTDAQPLPLPFDPGFIAGRRGVLIDRKLRARHAQLREGGGDAAAELLRSGVALAG